MINMGCHPTPGMPLQSEHSLDKNGLQFGFIALIRPLQINFLFFITVRPDFDLRPKTNLYFIFLQKVCFLSIVQLQTVP
jgi:hypothetical protein